MDANASLWSTWRNQRCAVLAAAVLHFVFFIVCAAAARYQAQYAYVYTELDWYTAMFYGIAPATILQTVFALLTLVTLVVYTLKSLRSLRQPIDVSMLLSASASCHPATVVSVTSLLLKLLSPLTVVSCALFFAAIGQYCRYQELFSDPFFDEIGPASQGWLVVWPMTFVILLATLWLTFATHRAAKEAAANAPHEPAATNDGIKYAMVQQQQPLPMYSVPYAQQPVYFQAIPQPINIQPANPQPTHLGGWTTSS